VLAVKAPWPVESRAFFEAEERPRQGGQNAKYLKWPLDGDPQRAPYRGLLALEGKDPAILFDRAADGVQRAVRSAQRRLTAVEREMGRIGSA
jgi:hypothetical protein